MKRTIRKLAGLLTVVLCLSLCVLAMPASAAETYQLTELLEEGKIKPLGRTQKSLEKTGITTDWPGSGFDINVVAPEGGGTMTVGYDSNYIHFWVVQVDNEEQPWRGEVSAGTGTFSVQIPAGEHTVRVVKDSQIGKSSKVTYYSVLTTLSFDGAIVDAPAQKDLYIEFIGDSYSCGAGTLDAYQPGISWTTKGVGTGEDSVTNAFTYLTAQKLDADHSIIARGGMGLTTGLSAVEGVWNDTSVPGIYQYVSGFNTANGKYDFKRPVDVVVIALGANDSVSASNKAEWIGLMKAFIEDIREKNPDTHIVLASDLPTAYSALMDVVKEAKDDKVHTFFYDFLGNGAAAGATQQSGHLSVEDNERYAQALADFIRSEDLIPTEKETGEYTDIEYYVSETGDDSNSGKSADAAKSTLAAVFEQVRADNSTFAANDRIVVYVDGTVQTDSQGLSGTELFCTADGTHIPVVLTTNGSATIEINDADGTITVSNDLEFKNIELCSVGEAAPRLYASGCKLTFDNAVFTTSDESKKWIVAADGSGSGNGTITFRNGDYTNLDYVTAVNEDAGDDLPSYQAKVVVEDGAQMSTVIGRYGTRTVGSAKVEIYGGSVAQYVGTASGSSTSDHKVYTGNVDLLITGGHIGGSHFSTAGKYVTIDGNINTEITGGIFSIVPTGTDSQYEGYFFGGNRHCFVDNINTTISGGQFYLFFDVAADSGYYFGVAGNGTVGNVTNKISCGAFLPVDRDGTGANCGVYLGGHMGSITGTLTNELSGGNFVMSLVSASDEGVYAGTRGVNCPIGKVVNVIGTKDSVHGPTFVGAAVHLAGGWAQVGTDSQMTAEPTACSDTVVVSNTIYGGEFGNMLYMGATGVSSGDYYSFVNGSIENNIYHGFFKNDVYGAGKAAVWGHVTTNIYGGHFENIYGGQVSGANIYDGVELNIYGMQEYYPTVASNGWVFCAGNKSGTLPVAANGGDAIKLTVAPNAELTMQTPLKVGDTAGTSCVTISDNAVVNFTANPEALLPKDAPYYVNYTGNGGYEMVRGYRNAGQFIDFGSSLAFTLYLQADNSVVSAVDTCVVVQDKEGEAVELKNVSVEVGTGNLTGKLIVTVGGIAAKEMRDDLTFTLTKDGETWFEETLSIYDAVMEWYEGSGTAVYKTMLADMLNYGRAAQDAFEYNTDEMGDELPGTTTTPDWGEVDEGHGATNGQEGKVGVSLSLKERVELNVYVDDKAAAIDAVTFGETEKALAEDTDYTVDTTSGRYTRIVFHNIPVKDVKQAVNFEVTLSDGGVFQMKYSIKDYVAVALKDETNPQKDLLVALQKYVDSVSRYLETQIDWIVPGEDETDPLRVATTN